MLPPELTRSETFRQSARILESAGFSANQILSAARELGFGIRRQAGLAIIRDLREERAGATAAGEAVTEITAEEPPREYKWGTLTQETDQFLRFDGPHALLFQIGGEAGSQWTDYTILPEDLDVIGLRLVTEEDEPSDPNDTRPGPYYHTSDRYPTNLRPAQLAQRLGLSPERVVRVIYDIR